MDAFLILAQAEAAGGGGLLGWGQLGASMACVLLVVYMVTHGIPNMIKDQRAEMKETRTEFTSTLKHVTDAFDTRIGEAHNLAGTVASEVRGLREDLKRVTK